MGMILKNMLNYLPTQYSNNSPLYCRAANRCNKEVFAYETRGLRVYLVK
jgi:hypothetical protein